VNSLMTIPIFLGRFVFENYEFSISKRASVLSFK